MPISASTLEPQSRPCRDPSSSETQIGKPPNPKSCPTTAHLRTRAQGARAARSQRPSGWRSSWATSASRTRGSTAITSSPSAPRRRRPASARCRSPSSRPSPASRARSCVAGAASCPRVRAPRSVPSSPVHAPPLYALKGDEIAGKTRHRTCFPAPLVRQAFLRCAHHSLRV